MVKKENIIYSQSLMFQKDGKRALCKECKSKFDAEYRKKNKEKIAKYFKEKWETDENIRAKK